MKKNITLSAFKFFLTAQVVLLISSGILQAQQINRDDNRKFSLSANIPSIATTSISLGTEIKIKRDIGLHLPISYNPWVINEQRFKHFIFQPELRFYTKTDYVFNGFFIGPSITLGLYNIGGFPIPTYTQETRHRRWQGNAYGASLVLGYQEKFYKHQDWGWQASVGGGFLYLANTVYKCVTCGPIIRKENRTYFGLTKFNLGLVYYIQ